MRKVLGYSVFTFILLLSGGFATKDFANDYCNSRFSFCIEFPAGFTGQGEAGNGDGQRFLSKDKQTEVVAYGMLLVEGLNEDISYTYDSHTSNLKVSYKVVKPDWFIISGLNKEGKIVYEKTAKKKIRYEGDTTEDTWVYQTLTITYPKSQQNIYGKYCGVIAKSF